MVLIGDVFVGNRVLKDIGGGIVVVGVFDCILSDGLGNGGLLVLIGLVEGLGVSLFRKFGIVGLVFIFWFVVVGKFKFWVVLDGFFMF